MGPALHIVALQFNAETATNGVPTYTGPFNKFKTRSSLHPRWARSLPYGKWGNALVELDYTSAEWPSSDTRNPVSTRS